MASGSMISWHIQGEKVEAVTDILFLGPKFFVDGDWSHEIRRQLLLGRKKKVKLLSSVQLFVTPWTVAYQAPLFMKFSRQGY